MKNKFKILKEYSIKKLVIECKEKDMTKVMDNLAEDGYEYKCGSVTRKGKQGETLEFEVEKKLKKV